MSLNPGMVISGPKLRPKQSVGKECPIVTLPTIDAHRISNRKVRWEEVTIDESCIELCRSSNHRTSPALWNENVALVIPEETMM